MHKISIALIYLIFLLSGAAALIYEVVWVRYLSLIFGGSHLAVTTVLAVFMGGLALGSYLIGKRVVEVSKLLRLYGLLELGIGLFALVFAGLMHLYPYIYIPLVQFAPTSTFYLSFIRVSFAVVALIVPTTLMGGTLPVLTSFVSGRMKGAGSRLSFLYGFNTLGAVLGAGAAGFVFLRYYSASTTLLIAVSINLAIGLISIALQDRVQQVLDGTPADRSAAEALLPAAGEPAADGAALSSFKLVLWGIGISGFCALGYEVLWTRIVSLVIGASVYGFTLILMAFLTGIALGSNAYGLFLKLAEMLYPGEKRGTGKRSIVGFGLVQVMIGLSALIVTVYIRELPSHVLFLQKYFQGTTLGMFGARQAASFVVAFSYMCVPAFFMGLAFPLAGKIHCEYRKIVGPSVGELLAYNTVGAILGSAVSGFVLIYLLGIERSLQLLTLVNIGFGLLVLVSLRNRKLLNWGVSGAISAAILLLACNPSVWRVWNGKLLAIYQTNRPDKFSTPQKFRDALANYDVLYYGEGVQTIVSSIRSQDGVQSFLTNGRIEASDNPWDLQCEYTLGHLPMLLHKHPKKVFVLGTGAGITLGATSVHPSVEQITLCEIEPKVLGVARTFARYNHNVLDNPKLKIVFNDGRNFLLTTKERFDVITADPVHPWFSGSGYLYTSEYFKLAAEHLNPGGTACQWLPIYELTNDNLKSIVQTFRKNFKYTMVWLTYHDAELVGSNSPLLLDAQDLERRIREPQVLKDLERVNMGSAEDFLSYFVMGDAAGAAYGSGGLVNTDDNLYLEFSAPLSISNGSEEGTNYYNLASYRESILPYLLLPADPAARAGLKRKWGENRMAAFTIDEAHARELLGQFALPDYTRLTALFDARYPSYAPWLFLRSEFTQKIQREPRILGQTDLIVLKEKGEVVCDRIAAVVRRISDHMSIVDFVSGDLKGSLGNLQVLGANREAAIGKMADDIMDQIRQAYVLEKKEAAVRGQMAPSAAAMSARITTIINSARALSAAASRGVKLEARIGSGNITRAPSHRTP